MSNNSNKAKIYTEEIEGVIFKLYHYGYSEVEKKEAIHIFDENNKFYTESDINAIPELKGWYDAFVVTCRLSR
ncbi:hypothetical protein [Lysinibacillus capsici]|uniref:hypothetical protein n=1 Tax=Lysinibacillus capsici TaxID=2115968 RepID=UPI0028A18A13|nr:hypothetical protein [Lysinibacillus capsici]